MEFTRWVRSWALMSVPEAAELLMAFEEEMMPWRKALKAAANRDDEQECMKQLCDIVFKYKQLTASLNLIPEVYDQLFSEFII